MATRQTNTEFLTDLMEFAPTSPLMQAFVLTAIEKYAAQCIAAGPVHFDSPGLRGAAWVAQAEHAKKALAAHLRQV